MNHQFPAQSNQNRPIVNNEARFHFNPVSNQQNYDANNHKFQEQIFQKNTQLLTNNIKQQMMDNRDTIPNGSQHTQSQQWNFSSKPIQISQDVFQTNEMGYHNSQQIQPSKQYNHQKLDDYDNQPSEQPKRSAPLQSKAIGNQRYSDTNQQQFEGNQNGYQPNQIGQYQSQQIKGPSPYGHQVYEENSQNLDKVKRSTNVLVRQTPNDYQFSAQINTQTPIGQNQDIYQANQNNAYNTYDIVKSQNNQSSNQYNYSGGHTTHGVQQSNHNKIFSPSTSPAIHSAQFQTQTQTPISQNQDIYQGKQNNVQNTYDVVKSQNNQYSNQYNYSVGPTSNGGQQSNPNKIFSPNTQPVYKSDQFLSPTNNTQNNQKTSPIVNGSFLTPSNRQPHNPIFSSGGRQQTTQTLHDIDISVIRPDNYENDYQRYPPKYQTEIDEIVKHSRHPTESSSMFNSPNKGYNSKRIFTEGNEQLNQISGYLKNVDILNSEERTKKSKAAQSIGQTQGNTELNAQPRFGQVESSQGNQIQDRIPTQITNKQQQMNRPIVQQAFCQNCLEFIYYQNIGQFNLHAKACKSIDETARAQMSSFVQRERQDHRNNFDENVQKQIARQIKMKIINSKIEKVRYLFTKMTNSLQDSDFLLSKPELKAYNIIEIKKSLEKIALQDLDYKFIQSCLQNIKSQEQEFDLISDVYHTPESTQYLQMIRTIPELVKAKINFIQGY